MDLHTYLRIYGPEYLDHLDTGTPGVTAAHPFRDRIWHIMNAAPEPTNHSPLDTADSFLLRALDTLSETIDKRFNQVDSRLDKMEGRFEAMVSKGEFEAEVKRLDREIEIRGEELNKLWSARRGDKEESAAALASKDLRFRWFVGVGISLATILSAVVFGVLNVAGA